jgi:ATP-dependent Lon protease
VIKESGKLALTWVKSNAYALKLVPVKDIDLIEKHDIHIHVPGGAVPKDGPSAGKYKQTFLLTR